MDVRELGSYIRDQRRKSRLTLQKLSGAAGVSMPYLSQVERGLRKPSAEIMQAIAKGLRISAETLYVQAGILEDRPTHDVISAITTDPSITERQKQAMIQIYEAFREEAARGSADAKNRTPGTTPARAATAAKRTANGASRKGTPRPGTAKTAPTT